MNPQHLTRRHFFGRTATGLGTAALATLLQQTTLLQRATASENHANIRFAPKAKRVIYLFQSGAPSQFETFDYKPDLRTHQGTELPDSIRQGQRLTGMTANQESFPIAASQFPFQQYGKSGTWLSSKCPTDQKRLM